MSIFEVGLHPKQEKPLKLSPYFIIQNTYAHDPIKIPKIRKKKNEGINVIIIEKKKTRSNCYPSSLEGERAHTQIVCDAFLTVQSRP